jgi:hypothetical protein
VSVCALAQTSVRSSSGIYFSSQIPDAQFEEMDRNFKELGDVPITKPDPKLASILQLSDLSPASLLGWLKERIHFVIEESYDLQPNVLNEEAVFPNPGITPVSFGGTDEFKSGDVNVSNEQAALAVLNIGSMHYKTAKSQGWLISMFVPGIGDVTLTSPRAGIVKLSEGYFSERVIGVGSEPQFHNARRTVQLATLFHEARHTDGHGVHLGFEHMVCPQGHPFAGLSICDGNLNGPYALEAHLLNAMNRSCDKCSLRERELLRMAAYDAASRVQEEIVDPTNDPVAVLKNTQVLSSMCNQVRDFGDPSEVPPDLQKDCSKLPQLRKIAKMIKEGRYKVKTIKSTAWDPTPEGSFDLNKDVNWLQ